MKFTPVTNALMVKKKNRLYRESFSFFFSFSENLRIYFSESNVTQTHFLLPMTYIAIILINDY